MTDVTRRLDLGRADENVQDQEQKIIDKLSKLIEKIEQQQQQQQQQQSQSQSQSQGNSRGGQNAPMNDSQAAGGSGTGDAARKNIEERDGWGKLPPAERKEALQQISRDLPSLPGSYRGLLQKAGHGPAVALAACVRFRNLLITLVSGLA